MSNTHEKIIKAAQDLFSTKGYAAATTKDIANLAGISEVTLFRHFESKRNLFHIVLHSAFEKDFLLKFFNEELKYNLDEDLKLLAHYMYLMYEANGSMMRMMMKDKEQGVIGEISRPKSEKKIKLLVKQYFEKMHSMGEVADDPVMCSKFFFSNTIGFLMRKFVFLKSDDGQEYYDWMVEKTIDAMKNKHNTDKEG